MNTGKPPDRAAALTAHIPALRGFAKGLTRDASLADDMVQDTLEKAWRNWDQFDPDTELRAWLFTILRNSFLSNLRKDRRIRVGTEDLPQPPLSVAPEHEAALTMRDFQRAFHTLPLHQREALILVGAQGFSYDAAARLCGVAPGTIKSRANRGRQRLARMMAEGTQLPADTPFPT